MKNCPFCAEEIQDGAIICRYCNRDVRAPVPPPPEAEVISSESGAIFSSPSSNFPEATSDIWAPRRHWVAGIAWLALGFLATFAGGAIGILGFLAMWIGSWLVLPGFTLFRAGIGFVIAVVLLATASGLRMAETKMIAPDSSLPLDSSGPSPPAIAALPVRDRFDIVSIASRITESNDVWSKFAWKLVLRNNTSEPLICQATVEFLDAEGFVVDDDREYSLVVLANQAETFTGYDLLTAGIVYKVENTQAKVNCR